VAHTLPFHAPARIGDAEVTLLPPATRSVPAMIVAIGEGRVAYTGDYKLRFNPFSPPAAVAAMWTSW
jgi:mRNA degradation ribonuclease J1/J2